MRLKVSALVFRSILLEFRRDPVLLPPLLNVVVPYDVHDARDVARYWIDHQTITAVYSNFVEDVRWPDRLIVKTVRDSLQQ